MTTSSGHLSWLVSCGSIVAVVLLLCCCGSSVARQPNSCKAVMENKAGLATAETSPRART